MLSGNNNNNNNKPTEPPPPKYKPVLYSIDFFTTYCVWWNPAIDIWQNEGCKVRCVTMVTASLFLII